MNVFIPESNCDLTLTLTLTLTPSLTLIPTPTLIPTLVIHSEKRLRSRPWPMQATNRLLPSRLKSSQAKSSHAVKSSKATTCLQLGG